jgi:hypothetical protein
MFSGGDRFSLHRGYDGLRISQRILNTDEWLAVNAHRVSLWLDVRVRVVAPELVARLVANRRGAGRRGYWARGV